MELLVIFGFIFLVIGLPVMIQKHKRKYFYKLSELKAGDYIAIQYGYSVGTAKVIANNPESRRIIIKVYIIGWLGQTETDYYSSYHFTPFIEEGGQYRKN
jgi:hypothetical protein